MPLKYSVIEIYTSEEVRCGRKLLYEEIISYIRQLKTAARCLVIKGVEGVYENGEIATRKVLNLSYNMPLKIEIILPASERETVLDKLEQMICEGIVGWRDLTVRAYKTRKQLFPRQIRLKDMMTPSPYAVQETAPLDAVVRRLLSASFTGVPVVDEEKRPVGIISQGDLIYRAGMPIRLALMAGSDPENLDRMLKRLASRQAKEIMTHPPVYIQEGELLTTAVNLMLKKNVKRLPVVDAWGRLSGIVSRMDVFQTITRESPDWEAIRQEHVDVKNFHTVADIMRKETHAVLPDTPLEEVIRIIDSDDIQRVAVVDASGELKGMISDRNLLGAFSDEQPGFWASVTELFSFSGSRDARRFSAGALSTVKAEKIMKTDLVTINQTASIDAAIALITDKEIKRLPVIDDNGIYKGMISRESLLRGGFSKV